MYRQRRSYLLLCEGISVVKMTWKEIRSDSVLMYLLNELVVREVCELIPFSSGEHEYREHV